MAEPPLTGIRVIDQTQALAGPYCAKHHGTVRSDQTQALAGPYCAMMLGDMGADVIKVERPGIGDQSRQWGPPYIQDQSTYYLAVNRNKRGIALNIAQDSGREIMHKLIQDADIFLTNIATRASLRKYQLDYETLNQINPRLIYASISGYGRSGPRADQPGYDLVAQAESGTMSLTGEVDGEPMRFLSPMADITCGMYTLIGILTALHTRHQTGRGQFLDQSLQEGQITWLDNYAGEYFATGMPPKRMGNRHPQIAPYEAVQGKDGDWFILGVGSDNVWRSFCQLVKRDDLMSDSRFAENTDRVHHYEVLLPIVRDIIKTRTVDEWLPMLRTAGVPAGRINTIDKALTDEHLLERGMIVELEHPALGTIKSIATPVRLAETPLAYRRHPPLLGEHTEEIMTELGYNREAVDNLRQKEVIA